jgi:scyllo-inositol 2-dehydrogenase (NADP+)
VADMKQHFETAEQIKAGIVGYGGAFETGSTHLRQMQAAGVTPCAVVDVDSQRLEAARKEFDGIETYSAVDDMLEKSAANLIAIITPPNTHARLAVQCLQAGRHVVVARPMAINTDQCNDMIVAADISGTLLSVYHNRHWDGCILRAAQEIRQNRAIGDVYRTEAHMGGYQKPGDSWHSSRTISGGILYDWGVHLLEYCLQLLDGRVVEVAAFAHSGFWAPRTGWRHDTNEDEAFAVARLDSDQWLTLSVSNLDTHPKGRDRKWVEVTGTEGTYLFDGEVWKTVLHGVQDPVEAEGRNPPGQGDLYYRNVVAALLGQEELVITPEWARRPIHIIDTAVRSAQQGRALVATFG